MTYLVDLIMLLLKVDCCIRQRRLKHNMPTLPSYLAYGSTTFEDAPTVCRFDTDSFKIGIGTFASYCMANNPNLFDNLKPTPVQQSVEGISAGLDIVGKGTFVFDIEDDNGSTIPSESMTACTYLI